MAEKKNEEKDNYLKSYIKIAIAFLVLALVFPFAVNAYFSDWTESGTFGDTFGALNAVFSGLALAGVVVTILIQRTELKNQREELILQRNEMKETRKEFLLNRTTTLVYNQLDRFEKALNDFRFQTPDMTVLKGNDAILYLDENKHNVFLGNEENKEANKIEMKGTIIELLKLYQPNKSEIEKFAHSTYNSVEVLKRLIYKTELEVEQLKDLKNLFFVNIGFINMGIIKRMIDASNGEFELLELDDYLENELKIGLTMYADLFLNSIWDFYELNLTKENFEEHRSKWINDYGELNQ